MGIRNPFMTYEPLPGVFLGNASMWMVPSKPSTIHPQLAKLFRKSYPCQVGDCRVIYDERIQQWVRANHDSAYGGELLPVHVKYCSHTLRTVHLPEFTFLPLIAPSKPRLPATRHFPAASRLFSSDGFL